ncbi:MAG: hypothetical protein ACREBI_08505 [Nitrosotalea sp.]
MVRLKPLIEIGSVISSIAILFSMMTVIQFFPAIPLEKALIFSVSIIPLVPYVISGKIETSIQKLRLRLKKPNEREILESRLSEQKQELLQKLDVVTKELEMIQSEDAQMARLAYKVVNEGSSKFATKEEIKELATKKDIKELAGMIYDLDKKTKNKQESATQNSTPEENTRNNQQNNFLGFVDSRGVLKGC